MSNMAHISLSLIKSSFSFSFKRTLSSVPIEVNNFHEHRSLVVEKYGRTEDVVLQVRKPEEVLPADLQPNQIVVEHLLSCVNPADINMIQGVYGIKPKLPFVAGNEGVMRVIQSYSVQDSENFFKIDNTLNELVACQLKVNPPTAYRMLKDYVQLKPGDCVIQNGANSAVGVYVVQLAKHWGFKTINVIRDRPNKQEVIEELKQFGADVVVTEEEVSNLETMTPVLSELGKPKLFLNCVGGKNAGSCARLMANGAHSVTYGAMSRQPFSPSAASLIFKQHTYVGFWMSKWYDDRQYASRSEIQSLLDELSVLFKSGVLKPKRAELINFEDRHSAFDLSSSANKKYMFSMKDRH